MKLLIDIPDTTYAFVKQLQWVSTGRGNCKTIQQTVINSIKFGVKQPQGEWIDPQDCFCYQCSNCGEYTNNEGTVEEGLFNFCPKCGADMRGKEE